MVENLLVNYINCPMNSDERKRAETITAYYFSAPAIQLLNLARDWVWTFLPHVLSKVHRVSFGMLREEDRRRWKAQIVAAAGGDASAANDFAIARSRWLLSVPFIGKDVPSRAAEFAHPDILLGLSVLAYRYNGLRESDMKMVVKELKKTLLNEPGPFTERPSRMLFEEFKGKALQQWNLEEEQKQKEAATKGIKGGSGKLLAPPELLPLELLQVDDPQQLRALVRLMSKVPEVVLFYLDSLVFPSVMKHRNTKLQASGVDLGSDMLFGTRLGFSGTPSDLLPRELQPCHYERGSEAKIVRVLTSTRYVDSELVPAGWSVDSLLREIARPSSGKNYNALIDTGALITGYSNQQVARLLLKFGLEGMDACVFIDSDDRRMVVDRLGGPPVPLARSGIKLEKRFTFYDQVHTTGMDIKQALDAVAVVTLGKDMTLRDFSQVGLNCRLYVMISSDRY